MSRLPTVGGDNNDWGSVLNDYLSVSLDTDGSIKASAIATKVDKVTGSSLITDANIAQVSFNTPVTVSYNTVIPLDKGLTIMTGKTLTTNDTFTILSSPVDYASCRVVLLGNGTAVPVFTNFDEQIGDYDATLNVKNIVFFYRLESVNYVSITQTVAV